MMTQILCDDEFQGRIRRNKDTGRYSLSNLTAHDMRQIKSALGTLLTQANVDAHQPEPFWWSEGGSDSGDHRTWFESWVRYYEQCVDTLTAAGIT
jgi:hypothetical protein